MNIAIIELTKKLRLTRKSKGLSQRAFAELVGIPQSRLSRIENGNTDLQTSSLLELSRSLGLELMLVPRQVVPLVNSLMRDISSSEATSEEKPLYSLDDENSIDDQDILDNGGRYEP